MQFKIFTVRLNDNNKSITNSSKIVLQTSNKKTVLIILFFILLANLSTAQSISKIGISDAICYPLKEGDDGINFTYFNNKLGKVSSYLSFKDNSYRLFAYDRLAYGAYNIHIPGKMAMDLFTLNHSELNCELDFSHTAFTTNRYSEKRRGFKVEINTPYGYEFKSYPEYPSMISCPEEPVPLRTNYRVKKTSKTAILGFIAGIGAAVAGLYYDKNMDSNSYGENDIRTGQWIAMGGGAVSLFSACNFSYYIPNTDLNNKNEQTNFINMEKYEKKISEIANTNNRRKANWEKQKLEIDEFNSLVRNTVTIKIRLK
uniref:hypothetical protein n=1 Tax=uncultured Draconibacterium sp. TaxID=1573823 RepID=UPI0032179F3E